jgi:hypothetical protein
MAGPRVEPLQREGASGSSAPAPAGPGQAPTVVRLSGLLQLQPPQLESLYWEHTCNTAATGQDQLYAVMSLVTILYAMSTAKLSPGSQRLHLASVAVLLMQSFLISSRLELYVRRRSAVVLAVRLLKLLSLVTMLSSYLASHELVLDTAADVIRTGLVLTGVLVNTLNSFAYRLRFRHQIAVDAAMAALLALATAPQLSVLLSTPDNLPAVSSLYRSVSAQSSAFFQHVLMLNLGAGAAAGAGPRCGALTLVATLQLYCCLLLPLYAAYCLERSSKLCFMFRYQQVMQDKVVIAAPELYEHPFLELRASDRLLAHALHAVKLAGLLMVTWLVVDTAVHHLLAGALGGCSAAAS